LQALQGELERMIEQCRHGKVSECRVIEVLGDHSRCLADDHLAPAAADDAGAAGRGWSCTRD
jgi:hypothetical protein